MLTIQAPAKLNLTLEVLGKRPDGYHEIRSIVQTISLCDSLKFELSPNISFSSNLPEWSAEKSLVSKAVNVLRKATGTAQGAKIEITKNIPLVSGLGGDSSDAAAVLRGLSQLWELDLTCNELTELAAQLGSDVSFFLYGGTALMAGLGEKITPLPPLPHHHFVLVPPDIPPLPDKTRQLYTSLGSTHYSDGEATRRLEKVLREGGKFDSSFLFNVFENIAFCVFPGLSEYHSRLEQVGIRNIHLAGSGPTQYSMFEDRKEAENIGNRLREQGMSPHLAETLPRNMY